MTRTLQPVRVARSWWSTWKATTAPWLAAVSLATARWILELSPPRDLPSASPSTARASTQAVEHPLFSGASSVLMRPDH